MHFPVVIVGSGFAGRTVASHLNKDSFLILERGERLDYAAAMQRAKDKLQAGAPLGEAEAAAYSSKLPWNATPRLSKYNYSRYALIGGGSSNWWGGKCSRLSEFVFASRQCLPWALTRTEMQPWYAMAERTLNVSGDPIYAEGEPVHAMPGAEYWREAFKPYFNDTHVYNVALNHGNPGPHGQGRCQGRSACAVCYHDAKARPDNIFAPQNILYESLVTQVNFNGARAVSLEVYNGKELYEVTFDRLVIAANGLESPRLLARSNLPADVRRQYLGHFLQDHAHYALTCRIPKRLGMRNLGGLCHAELRELAGPWPTSIGPIEVGALAITHPAPNAQHYANAIDLGRLQGKSNDEAVRIVVDTFRGIFQVYCEFEIPPQAGNQVDLESEHAQVLDGEAYPRMIAVFDEVAEQLKNELRRRGVQILGEHCWYRNGYGGHHFCGTLNMSDSPYSVVDTDSRLIGTDNVYVAGAAVIPRAGGVAPTLTLVALAHRLGAHLAQGGGAA